VGNAGHLSNTEQREVMLRPGVTVIGSASDADVRDRTGADPGEYF
jgi:hypothetical protein